MPGDDMDVRWLPTQRRAQRRHPASGRRALRGASASGGAGWPACPPLMGSIMMRGMFPAPRSTDQPLGHPGGDLLRHGHRCPDGYTAAGRNPRKTVPQDDYSRPCVVVAGETEATRMRPNFLLPSQSTMPISWPGRTGRRAPQSAGRSRCTPPSRRLLFKEYAGPPQAPHCHSGILVSQIKALRGRARNDPAHKGLL